MVLQVNHSSLNTSTSAFLKSETDVKLSNDTISTYIIKVALIVVDVVHIENACETTQGKRFALSP